jgi:hypothetical protein
MNKSDSKPFLKKNKFSTKRHFPLVFESERKAITMAAKFNYKEIRMKIDGKVLKQVNFFTCETVFQFYMLSHASPLSFSLLVCDRSHRSSQVGIENRRAVVEFSSIGNCGATNL